MVTTPTSPLTPGHLTPADLAAVEVGRTCTVDAVSLDRGDRLRLAEMGLRPGVTVTVLGRTSGGGRLLAFGTNRVALDRSTAHRITAHVEPR